MDRGLVNPHSMKVLTRECTRQQPVPMRGRRVRHSRCRIRRNPSCGMSSEMDQSCGTESPLYRCFRDTWISAVSDICDHQPCGRGD